MTCTHGAREGFCDVCYDEATSPESPPDLVVRCEACSCEEPAPADAVPGQTIDCACCGEIAEVEVT